MSFVGQKIITTAEDVKTFQKGFQSFMTYDVVFIVIASAVCAGMITRDTMSSMLREAIYPLLMYIAKYNLSYLAFQKLINSIKEHKTLTLILSLSGKMIWYFITWFLSMYLIYIIFIKIMKINIVGYQASIVEDVTKVVQENIFKNPKSNPNPNM